MNRPVRPVVDTGVEHPDPADQQPQHPLAMVYGGGGVVGIAYILGVAEGLARSGIPVAQAPALGTSAGSWAASALALGLGYADLADLPVPSLPTRRSGVLAETARLVFGEATHDLVSVSTVRLRSGRRHIFHGGGPVALADLVAASSAVPGLLPPHRIDGHRYIDGGMWSATSVDAAADARTVVVVAPIAGRVMGPMGRVAGALLERELDQWRRHNPAARIWMVRPNREMSRIIGVRPLALFDADRARAVHPLARAQGVRLGEQVQRTLTGADLAARPDTDWWDAPDQPGRRTG